MFVDVVDLDEMDATTLADELYDLAIDVQASICGRVLD
jgi:hypothetical protein